MDLSGLKGIGPVRAENLRAMGIVSLRDLLYTLPVRYEDRITVYPCNTKVAGNILISGIIDENPRCSFFRGISRVTASVHDNTGKLPICWFNEPWIVNQLPVGQPVMLYGRLTVKNNRRCLQNPQIVTEKCLMPVYHAIKGFPAKSFRKLISDALTEIDDCCPETLPKAFRNRYHLCELNYAIRQAHFPDDNISLNKARRRLAFENILIYLNFVYQQKGKRVPGFAMIECRGHALNYQNYLDFTLTDAQKKVISEIADDLENEYAMARLVQGDVGCGKTAVAFAAIYMAVMNHFQAAMMAPTEILACQHYEDAKHLFDRIGIRCRLLTGSTRAAERRSILRQLACHECDVVFGTHVLISQDVEYSDLGLVITDEQHRFGVNQRTSLQEKGKNDSEKMPHVLVMSATPIPRSLSLILYGDLDLSVIDELPAGRLPVRTRLVPDDKKNDMYGFLRDQVVKNGKQAYIVCPLVEGNDDIDDLKSAKKTYSELVKNELKDLKVGLTWGSQKSADKEKILTDFQAGTIQVLVSTTVIEVGVNVPNATVMIIENAERFGLSQLHQLRGRVGRGNDISWCFLLSAETEKLKVLCSTNDGFEIARKDLELRGPGDLLGTRQSGDTVIGISNGTDAILLEEVSKCVKELHNNTLLSDECEMIDKISDLYFSDEKHKIARN